MLYTTVLLCLHMMPCLPLASDPNDVLRDKGCNATALDVVENLDTSPWSCQNRCGAFNTSSPCACDSRCVVYGDCCSDFMALCPEQAREPPERQRLGQARCVHYARLISSCPRPPASAERDQSGVGPSKTLVYRSKSIHSSKVVRLCETPWNNNKSSDVDILQLLAVTDNVTGHHFLNLYCFLCHGGPPSQALTWAINLAWPRRLGPVSQHVSDLQTLLNLARDKDIRTEAVAPSQVSSRHCVPAGAWANVTCGCPGLEQQCRAGPEAYVVNIHSMFRNLHCLTCSRLSLSMTVKSATSPNMLKLAWVGQPTKTVPMFIQWSKPHSHVDSQLHVQVPDEYSSFPWEQMMCRFVPRAPTNVSSEAEKLTGTSDASTSTENSTYSQIPALQTDKDPDSRRQASDLSDMDEHKRHVVVYTSEKRTDSKAEMSINCRPAKCSKLVYLVNGSCSHFSVLSVVFAAFEDLPHAFSQAAPVEHGAVTSGQIEKLVEDGFKTVSELSDFAHVLNVRVTQDLSLGRWNTTTHAVIPVSHGMRSDTFRNVIAGEMKTVVVKVLKKEFLLPSACLKICGYSTTFSNPDMWEKAIEVSSHMNKTTCPLYIQKLISMPRTLESQSYRSSAILHIWVLNLLTVMWLV